jgi:hypothetical protein
MKVELCNPNDAAFGSDRAVAFNSAGEIVWAFSSPAGDPFVNLAVEEEVVLLWTSQGYRYTVSKADGSLLSTTFVK